MRKPNRDTLVVWLLVGCASLGFFRGLWGSPGKAIVLISDALVIAFGVAALFHNMRHVNTVTLPITFFVLLCFIRLVDPNIPDLETAYLGARKTIFFLLTLAVGCAAWGPKPSQISKAIFITALVSLGFALKQRFYWSDFDARLVDSTGAAMYTGMFAGQMRGYGLFSSPFTLGMLGALAFPLSAGKPLFWRFASAILGAVLVALAATRVNAIAFLAGGATVIFLSTFRRGHARVAAVMLTMLLGLLLASFSADEVGKVLADDSRFYGRIGGYAHLLSAMIDSPLRAIFGYGIGSAGDTLGARFASGVHATSHNVFLKLLFETGALGLLMFLWLLGAILVRLAKQNTKTGNAAIAACVVILVNGATGSAIESFPVVGMAALYIGAACRRTPIEIEQVGASLLPASAGIRLPASRRIFEP